ncbi:MAG: LiaF transmembrane domain-containing protein [Candidatus Promineifilaceae bacterium]
MGHDNYDRKNNSLFAPIVLIAIGVFWLLSNFGVLPPLDWGIILRLWPLLLIFWGLNLIFRSAPRPFSSLLSALLGIIAVGSFAIIVLFGAEIPFIPASDDKSLVRNVAVSAPLNAVESAEISLETGLVAAELYALTDSDKLVDGTVSYMGDLIFNTDVTDSPANVQLDTKARFGWVVDPSNWQKFNENDKWELGLSPQVPLDLKIDAGKGSGNFMLGELQLSNFELDGSEGQLTIVLPDGTYDANIHLEAGASTWTLPASGSGNYKFDSKAGAVQLWIPKGMETQIDIKRGAGQFSADSRFKLVDGDLDDGVWQTAGYDSAENRLDIKIKSSAGSINVQLPTGR